MIWQRLRGLWRVPVLVLFFSFLSATPASAMENSAIDSGDTAWILVSTGLVLFMTIPALALLVILLPAVAGLGLQGVGMGSATAVLALFLYSLLPIVRNTHAGLKAIESHYYESAVALGLPPWYRLLWIELPLASRSILAGIKTAAVINVGFATLGALIGFDLDFPLYMYVDHVRVYQKVEGSA